MTIDSSQSNHDKFHQTIEARLLETRRRLKGLALPAASLRQEDAAGPSTITHPFYDRETTKFSRSSVQSTISDIQRGIKSFLSDVNKESSSDAVNAAYPSNGAEDFSIAVGGEGGADAEALKSSNDRKSLLVSLLREQSNHSLAVSGIRDDLDGLIGIKEIQSITSLEALMICALSLEDDVAKKWPTRNLEEASKGLDDAVHAFEAIAKDMQLESFADQHESSSVSSLEQQKRVKEYTITFAARILVIDVDLTLEQAEEAWMPKSKVRISYATDSSNGNDVNRFRNAKLAELLGMDVHAIVAAIFGFTKGDRRKEAAKHLGRLQGTVKILKRLDDLSETVSVSGYPDLFALMEDVGTEKLVKYFSSTNSNNKIICKQHDGYPYATILLHGDTTLDQEGKGTEGFLESYKKTYMLRMDIGRSTLTVDVNGNIDEEKLPKLQSPTEDSSMQYLVRIKPALAMQLRTVRQISRLIGLETKEGRAETSAFLQGDNVKQRTGIFNLTRNQANRIDIEEEEEAIYVDCIPIASYKHLMEILPVLQEQVNLNEILSTIYTGAAQSGEESNSQRPKVSIDLSEVENPIIRIQFGLEKEPSQTLSVNLQKKDEKWLLEGSTSDEDGNTVLSLPPKDASQIADLLEDPKKGLRDVISSLQRWAAEGAIEEPTNAVKSLKRRSSEAGLSADNTDSVRPTNRRRNEQ